MQFEDHQCILLKVPFVKKNLVKHRTHAVFDWLAKSWVTNYEYLEDVIDLCDEFKDIGYQIIDCDYDYPDRFRVPLTGKELLEYRKSKKKYKKKNDYH